jgi:hypothetical protein
MKIDLHQDSIVDQRTGAIDTPADYLDNLRSIEVGIARADEEIDALRSDLKAVRDRRETLVAQLRSGVREGRVLPIIELAEKDAPEGLDVPEAD